MASATEVALPEKANSLFGERRNGNASDLEGGNQYQESTACVEFMPSVKFFKKVGAELIGTFFLMFIGIGSVVLDKKTNGTITHLGVAIAWGLVVMILVYSVGHISGAHFNPSVTLAFATVRRFPLINVPAYIGAQVVGSLAAVFLLRLMFGNIGQMAPTIPTGSRAQSFFTEMIITFFLMFVVSGVGTDTKAIGELGGLAVGSTICLIVIVFGPVSGASLNPARTLGSAIAGNQYKAIWIYMIAPPMGAILGAWSYDAIRISERPVSDVTKSGPFLKSLRSRKSQGN